jgi:repressor LexA
MTMADKIRAILKESGMAQGELAARLRVSQPTVHRWLRGSEPEGHRRDAINQLYDEVFGRAQGSAPPRVVPVMGYVGAGSEVEPDFEQVPPEGLEQIDLPFSIDEELIAFKVRGDSMLPFYKDGAMVVVYRDQKRPLESFYGEDAAVRTVGGRRFIKTIMRGNEGVNLISWNAAPIENVHLEWIGEIFATLAPSQARRFDRQERRRQSKSA